MLHAPFSFREQPNWKPCGVSVATLIEAVRNAAAKQV
jgi:hypothetical protein